MARLHPDVDFLSEYAAGSLSPAQNAAISAHLHFCDECRDHVNSLEEIGGWIVEQAESSPVSESMLDAIMACLDGDAARTVDDATICITDTDVDLARLPKPIQKLVPGGKASWRKLSRAVKVALIPVGERRFELALHKIKAGGRAPTHDHQGTEITVVIQGSFSDSHGAYRQGDFIVRQPGEVHAPIATRDDHCICLSVSEGPIRMTSPIGRFINPFLRFNPA